MRYAWLFLLAPLSLCGCEADGVIVESCGNGVVEPAEHCDDGNRVAGDGCVGCMLEARPYAKLRGPLDRCPDSPTGRCGEDDDKRPLMESRPRIARARGGA